MQRPLVICCSQRFKEDLGKFITFLKRKGLLVRYPDFKYHRTKFTKKPEHLRPKSSSHKTSGLVLTHLRKIDKVANMGGVCLIFNPLPLGEQKKKFGYIGKNTLGEIFYAEARYIDVIMIKPNEEDSINGLIPPTDKERIFTLEYPKMKNKTLDFDLLWDNWLSKWLNGGPHG